jgi:3-oxoacyl-[acyl-carrier protein] reductase
MAIALDFSGRTVWVAGGGSGIGAGISRAFLAAGARVAISYLTSGAEADAIAATAPERAFALAADLTGAAGTEAAHAAIVERLGAVDVLIANTGGMVARSSFLDTNPSVWQSAFDVNVMTCVHTARAVLPGMIARKFGSIVAMSSISAHHGGSPGSAHYSAAKAAVHTLTRTLAKEMAPHGIRVNAVAPGLIGTRFHDAFSSAEKRAATVAQTPLKREGTPDDVAGACLYLASDLASFVTGEVIEVNGGIGMF